MSREHPPESPPSPYRVADTAGYLAGHWAVERTVQDRLLGMTGGFVGTACFRSAEAAVDGSPPHGPGGLLLHAPGGLLLHEEEGTLRWDGGTFPSSRTLRLLPRGDGTADVEFADGRPFHALDLRGGWWNAVHPCAADRYEGTYAVRSADEWHLEWRVTGPAKEHVLRSVYRRLGDR
ncbi:DUF6314 family protein [Streptomyces sp. NBC_00237]|uniref:DUF6314 family protein n=1 Tax=Streptomyces sp. NBC_00237 TaxID=2975687 RepID=UPI0022550728|nr:DUF6314 family protein [Streptomyces sp. NBC_00237]MCX5205413.1 DUF6314 family protein [Streptomyces sp. NBC_00237]